MRLASKGVTKSGEAFCMSCGAAVEQDAGRCESCYSQLDQEVKAFHCPRCESILELGTPQCGRCGMRFKVKTVRPSDTAEDQRILDKLISFGRRGPEKAADEGPAAQEGSSTALSPQEEASVKELTGRIAALAQARGRLSSSMAARLSEAEDRIARIESRPPSDPPLEDIEAELKSLADDLAGVQELISSAGRLAGDVLHALELPGMRNLAEGRDLESAARAISAPPAGATHGELLDREEQVRKREEMVDRKIKAYAQKKKQLEAMEAHMAAGTSPQTLSQAAPDVPEEVVDKVKALHAMVSSEEACEDLEPCLDSLEQRLRELVATKAELEQRMAQLREGEDEVRSLLKALDNLLGQLPADVIDGFSKSDEFKLYERVLDRLGV